MRGADSRLHTPLALLSGTDLLRGLCQVHSLPCSSASLLMLPSFSSSPSVRWSNDQWSAPRTPPGVQHGDKLTMGDKVPQNCLGDEEVLNVPLSPLGQETADLVGIAMTGKRGGGMSQCQKIPKIGWKSQGQYQS